VFRRPVIVLPPPVPVPVPTAWARWRLRLRRLVRLAVVAVVVAVAALGAALAGAFAWSLPSPSAGSRSVGVNALWARHSWAGEAHGEDELDAFAARLREGGISDVFAHVGPLGGDGSLAPDRHPGGAALVAGLHRRVPGLRVQAQLDGPVRLAEPAVRDRAVAAAEGLLADGFDGVHYDLRAARPGDPAFLDLLTRTRVVTGGRGAVLSVALDALAPHPALAPLLGRPDDAALDAVADRADQLVLRTDGSGLPTASAFAAWQAWQTERAAAVVGDRATLFVTVSTDPVDGGGHHPWAESMASGLHGLRRGLDALGPSRASRQPVGAAVWSEWTATAPDWRQLRDDWLEPPA
jgi:hypothetical protein